MKIHYRHYPTDYIEQLHIKGKRLKARCFWEYYHDLQKEEVNSIEFYRKSWMLSSKGTVHKWIMEFRNEISLHYSSMDLMNIQHYTSVKNKSERQVNEDAKYDIKQCTDTPLLGKNIENKSERQVNEDSNINILDKREENQFRTLFTLFGFFKMSGKRSKAEEAFVSIKNDIAFDNLFYAAKMYLKDTTIKNKYWLPNFLIEQIYVGYMKQQLKVKIDDVWVVGEFNAATETFKANSKSYTLRKDIMLEKLEKSEIEFLVGDAA